MIKIRTVKPADLPKLAKIYADVYQTLAVGEKWTAGSALKFLKYWQQKQPDLALIAVVDSKIAGAFFSAIKPYWDGNHLFDGELFVAAQYQRQGIGKLLLAATLKIAIKKYRAIKFEAFTFSRRSHQLGWYKKIGITPSKDYVFISGEPKTILAKLS